MNPSDESNPYLKAIGEAKHALEKGDKPSARHWALRATQINPNIEDPWLILAAVSSPKASIEYLKQALSINPQSQRARQGMHWAVRRLRQENLEPALKTTPMIITSYGAEALVRKKPAQLPFGIIFLLILPVLLIWFAYPDLSLALGLTKPIISPSISSNISSDSDAESREEVLQPTSSPISVMTATFTQIPSPTATITRTPLPTDTPYPTPTDTPLPTSTDTPPPTPTETIVPTEEPEPTRGPDGKFKMPSVKPGQRWIDVDLSQQRVYAFEGDQIIDSFRVSTGTSRTPTVTGTYKIYVKYRSADMSGPGYHLEDVPFVMYFYGDYGLHGTYWHDNFGTPMSHGCVNLKTKDAKWLFDWVSLGTIVNIHR